MKYIKFTYVDSLTGESISKSPAINGPVFPNIEGLEFIWARESEYPIAIPEFFGICPDETITDVEGFLGEFPEEDWNNMKEVEFNARLPAVPQEVSMAQCRLALFDKHGIETDQEFYSLVDILPEEDRPRARLELKTRPTVEYKNALVTAFCIAKEWDKDDLFRHAASL